MNTYGVDLMGRRRRRRHSAQFKQAVIGECMRPRGIDRRGRAASWAERQHAAQVGDRSRAPAAAEVTGAGDEGGGCAADVRSVGLERAFGGQRLQARPWDARRAKGAR